MQCVEEGMASALELAQSGSLERPKPGPLEQLKTEVSKARRSKASSITLPIKNTSPKPTERERRRPASLRKMKQDSPVGRPIRQSSIIGYEAKFPPLEFIENLATQPDFVFKILVVGNSYVGKSSFLMRLCTNAFSARYSSTIGVDFYSKALRVDDKILSLQLWDTAGQERFQSVTKAYYRGAQGVILMYDVSQEESFIAVKSWISSIQENTDELPVGMLLVGNKTDLDEYGEREVSTETGETFSKIYGADFIETSAKTGYNVGNALMMLVRDIKRHYEEGYTGNHREPGILVSKSTTSKCCLR